MGILIVLFVALFLVLLLSAPLIAEARASVSLRGAIIFGRIFLFGLIPIPIRLRIHLFSAPYFTFEIGKKQISLLKKQKDRRKKRLQGIRVLQLDTKTTVGIENEPARSVMIAGTIAVVLSMLISRIAENGSARAALSKSTMFRIAVWGRGIVQPVPLLAGILRERISKRKAANNTCKINEKRTTYASC